MNERQQTTADGETEDQLNDDMVDDGTRNSELPVDESDDGPAPAIRGDIDNDDDRNTNDERQPTIDAEDAKYA